MFHTNLSQLTQQILMLPFPQDYKVLGLESLSIRPYTFSMILNNGRISRALNLEVEFDGTRPRFFVTHIAKTPVERFELITDFDRVFNTRIAPVTKVVEQQVVEVHPIHVMNQQKELLKNRLSVMLDGFYKPSDVKITHNDGISAEGYFVYLQDNKYLVRGFRLGMTGILEIMDFDSKAVIATHEAATLSSGYSAEARAAAEAVKERELKESEAAARRAMTPEERRRLYSRNYYKRHKGKK